MAQRDDERSDYTESSQDRGNTGAGREANPDTRVDRQAHVQHARRGQAQSPVEETLDQPEKKQEGHS